MTLQNRVAVVTGANRGIGQAIAVALGATGARVVITARDVASLDETESLVAETGAQALRLACDVTDEPSVAAMTQQALDWGGNVDVVVANAGIAGPTTPMHELPLAEWRDVMTADLDGVFLTFRGFVPGMIEQRSGSLIAISSMTGKRPLSGRTPYAAAKMGVIGLVRTLATELGPHGVRANTICPGAVNGPRIDGVVEKQAEILGISPEQARAALTDASPLRRFVEAREVADMAVFLAGDGSAAITGADLNVAAGAIMY